MAGSLARINAAKPLVGTPLPVPAKARRMCSAAAPFEAASSGFPSVLDSLLHSLAPGPDSLSALEDESSAIGGFTSRAGWQLSSAGLGEQVTNEFSGLRGELSFVTANASWCVENRSSCAGTRAQLRPSFLSGNPAR